MTPTDMLREAETDLAALANLPGEIRARVKAGVAELTRIRDAIEAAIAALTGKAGLGLGAGRARAHLGARARPGARQLRRLNPPRAPAAGGGAPDPEPP